MDTSQKEYTYWGSWWANIPRDVFPSHGGIYPVRRFLEGSNIIKLQLHGIAAADRNNYPIVQH